MKLAWEFWSGVLHSCCFCVGLSIPDATVGNGKRETDISQNTQDEQLEPGNANETDTGHRKLSGSTKPSEPYVDLQPSLQDHATSKQRSHRLHIKSELLSTLERGD